MAKENKENIDHSEVEKFNLLAHKWWDETSEFKPLHQINPLRLNFISNKPSSLSFNFNFSKSS